MPFVYKVECTDITKYTNTSAPAIWKDKLCTLDINKAINKGNELLGKGYDVAVQTWTQEDDFEICVLSVEEKSHFADYDGIVSWQPNN